MKEHYPDYAEFLDDEDMLDMVAWLDEDCDTLLNWEESALNTDPTVPDGLTITGIKVDNGTVTLSFYPAEANPDYPRIIEGKTNLVDDWEPVDYARHRFFRFRVVLPEVDTP